MVKTKEPAKSGTGINPAAIRNRVVPPLESQVRQMPRLSSGKPEDKIVAVFGASIKIDSNKEHDRISSKVSRIFQVVNIIELMVAWNSYNAVCLGKKRKHYMEMAKEKFGEFWEQNKHKPTGICLDSKGQITFKFYESEVGEEKALKEPFLGTVVLFGKFPDNQAAAEIITCFYNTHECEVGHKEACSLFGLSLLARELGEVPKLAEA